jgi:hypothetical protein
MATKTASVEPRGRGGGRSRERSNLLLVVICLAQFMVILDVSIVNVALQKATRSDSHRDDRDPGTRREARAIGAAQGRHVSSAAERRPANVLRPPRPAGA